MNTKRIVPGLLLGLLAAFTALWVPNATGGPVVAYGSSATAADASTVRYGERVDLGLGDARTYVEIGDDGTPTEVGVALDERALDGLPETGLGHYGGPHAGHASPHIHLLDLPDVAGLPFRFLELNWNPTGHEPDGVYEGAPHFDFHFYTIAEEERETIVPTNPTYAERANRLPAEEYVPPFNAALGPPGLQPADFAVPLMGVHWTDVRSPELQGLLGNPEAYRPFTSTFIHGSWDGRWIFWEPMITRAHLLAKKTAADPSVRDEIIPIPIPDRYQAPGYYPTAYRITWDPEAREYRISLTALVERG